MRLHHRAVLGLVFLLISDPQGIGRAAPDSFADLANRLLPTVVNISTRETVRVDAADASAGASGSGSSLDELFKNFGGKDAGKEGTSPQQVSALGSGFVIDSSGLIVTNDHVIEGAESITVTLEDGTNLPATVVGRDDETDLALLRVKPASPLPAAHFGDSDQARIGDWVIAIGNPFGLGSSVTAGIVSARNRDIAEGPYDDFIQTDAPINRGNSGGPLFDQNGNVVGVTSALFSPSGGSVGVGFAIPSSLARAVIGQLREFGRGRRGWIGVRVQPVTRVIADSLGIGIPRGALVSEVTADSPAARAGLVNGDVITAIDGRPITKSHALPRLVAELQPGRTVSVEVLHSGLKQVFNVAVEQLEGTVAAKANLPAGSPARIKSDSTDLGLALAPVDSGLRAKYRLDDKAGGVVVTGIQPQSPAGDSDFQPGDIVLQVQNEAVGSPDQVSDRVAEYLRSGHKAVLFLVSRNGRQSYIALPLAGTE